MIYDTTGGEEKEVERRYDMQGGGVNEDEDENGVLATVSWMFREHRSAEQQEGVEKSYDPRSKHYELSGHPKANAIRFSKRAVTISVQIGSPDCLMVNLAIAFLSAEVAGS